MAPPRAPHQVYSDELSHTFRRGHPIAVPHPSTRNGQLMRPISIGDVGYIHPSGGNFVRLFNVHLEPGSDGQPEHQDLPEGFEYLTRSDIQTVPNATPMWASRSVTRKSACAGITGPFLGGLAEFESSAESGAILATPDPIDWSDALNIMSYKVHVRTHIESWLRFARGKGHDIKLEQLVLVTGVDSTTSWATAVFSGSKLEAGFGLELQFATVGVPVGLQLAYRYSWNNTSSALVNSGPSPRGSHPMPLLTSNASADLGLRTMVNTAPERRPINTTKDQCLFIRHIRAKRRLTWMGMKLEAAGSDDESDSGDSMDDEGAGGTVGDIAMTSSPRAPEFVDCLEPALDHILQYSSADIAIAHDEDLERLPFSEVVQSDYNIEVQGAIGMFRSNTKRKAQAMEPDEAELSKLTSTHDMELRSLLEVLQSAKRCRIEKPDVYLDLLNNRMRRDKFGDKRAVLAEILDYSIRGKFRIVGNFDLDGLTKKSKCRPATPDLRREGKRNSKRFTRRNYSMHGNVRANRASL